MNAERRYEATTIDGPDTCTDPDPECYFCHRKFSAHTTDDCWRIDD